MASALWDFEWDGRVPSKDDNALYSGDIRMQVNWEKIQPVLWGAVGGGIVLAIIGFAWGGWVTGSTAQKMAEELRELSG